MKVHTFGKHFRKKKVESKKKKINLETPRENLRYWKIDRFLGRFIVWNVA